MAAILCQQGLAGAQELERQIPDGMEAFLLNSYSSILGLCGPIDEHKPVRNELRGCVGRLYGNDEDEIFKRL